MSVYCPQATAGEVIVDARFVATTAWARYEAMWLPLLCAWDARPDEPALAAPLDVAIVWLAHLSRPSSYAQVPPPCRSKPGCTRGLHPCIPQAPLSNEAVPCMPC